MNVARSAGLRYVAAISSDTGLGIITRSDWKQSGNRRYLPPASNMPNPLFIYEHNREAYLCKLIAKGYRVERAMQFVDALPFREIADWNGPDWPEPFTGELYTVKEKDGRKNDMVRFEALRGVTQS